MFGKSSRVNPLESRKQQLVAESEINRAQVLQEWEALAGGVSSLAHRAKSFSSFAGAAALLAASLSTFRRSDSTPAAGKPSGLETMLKSARLVCSIWLVLRARSRS